MKARPALVIPISCALLLFSVSRLAAQTAPVKKEMKSERLLAPPNPSAKFALGALLHHENPKWHPKDGGGTFVDPRFSFTRGFYEQVVPQNIAFEDTKRTGKFGTDLAFSPGPQILQAAQLASGKVGIGFSRESLKFMDWGRLTESSVPAQLLTEACLRGWLDLPGPALHGKALLQWQLSRPLVPQRPWVVARAVTAQGLRYSLMKDTGIKFDLSAGHAAYGSGSLGLNYKVKNETTLEIDDPMGIGFDAVRLERISEPLPALGDADALAKLNKTYTFYWRHARSQREEPIHINIAEFRAAEARVARPEDLAAPTPAAPTAQPPAVVTNLLAQLQAGKPVSATLLAEARPANGPGQWRAVAEGEEFRGNELVRLRVVLDQPGFVYVLAKDGTGQAAVLYPGIAGEPLAKGEERQLPKGEWNYPAAVTGDDGLQFDVAEPAGTESFLVIVSQTKLAGLPKALAEFASAGRQFAQRNVAAASGDYAFASLLRLPTGTAKIAPPAVVPTNAPPADEVQLFSGVNSATVLKLNLRRVPPPVAKAGQEPRPRPLPGVERIPTGMTRVGDDRQGPRMVDTLDYYANVPSGTYRNLSGIFIGVGKYRDSAIGSLDNPPADARELAASFQKISGMKEVRVLVDQQATLEAVTAALRELGSRDGPGDLFVFHFSGHGIGLDNQSGRMLLHDANLGTLRAEAGEGVLEMTLINRLLDDAGIDAKHRLLLLDCCYSGMGARPVLAPAQTRSVFAQAATRGPGGLREQDRRDNALQFLNNRAVYIVTAGGAGQPVLDGGSGDYAKHGLLSGYVLRAMQRPKEFDFNPVTLDGVPYVPMRDVFGRGSEVIRVQARRIMNSAYAQWKSTAGGNAQRSVTARNAERGESVFARVRSDQDLAKLVQNPQDLSPEEGEVYLPLSTRRSRRDAGEEAPVEPDPNPQPAGEPTPDPVVEVAVPTTQSDFARWAAAVGNRYSSPAYGASLRRVFELLNTGQPGGEPATLQVEAELERRPIIHSTVANQGFPPAELARSYGNLSADPSERLQLAVEDWRSKNAGWNWSPMPSRNGVVSPNYEIHFRLANRGTAPLTYYLISHDADGILQWIAPANDSAPTPDYTFGTAPLAPQQPQILPSARAVAGRTLTEGWPIISVADQQFYLVVTPRPWPELEAALRSASREGFRLAQLAEEKKLPAGTPLTLDLPAPTTGTRAVGPVQKLVATPMAPPPAAASAGAPPVALEAPAVLNRTQGRVLVLSWHLKVVPPERMQPSF